MNETWLGTIPLIGTIITAIGCWLYMLGGRSGKWQRRFAGSLTCATAIWVEALLVKNFNIWMLSAYPLLIGTFVLGYGSDITLTKIVKRSIVVATSLTVGVIMCIVLGGAAWWVLPIQVAVAAMSIYLGVKNPIQAAPEEFFVCLLLTECNLMYPFVKGVIT
jgi:hypothetical protein